MKRILLIILALFLFFINLDVNAAPNYTTKQVKAVSVDGFNIEATMMIPKIKEKKEFSTVVLLHSLGYNSQWWGDLPQRLIDKGYAVVTIDLRGHGASIYNSKFSRVSWKDMTNKAYAKYPDDVLSVLNTIRKDNPKRVFFNNWAIVASDIGASAGILASGKFDVSPKTIVMISPVTETRGLFTPIAIAELEGVDFLSINGSDDFESKKHEAYMKKFAQSGFTDYVSDSRSKGMVLLKNDNELSKLITEWVSQYLN